MYVFVAHQRSENPNQVGNQKLFLSMYWCACVRILLLQLSQTFESIILVFIIVVRLHSDAYLRSLSLSHKIGVTQIVLDQYNLAENVLDQFFSHLLIYFRVNT